MHATMMSSLLQQQPPKERIGLMEHVDVQLPVFAAGTSRGFSCGTHTHYSKSNCGSPKHKKRPASRQNASSFTPSKPEAASKTSNEGTPNHPPKAQSVSGSSHSTSRVVPNGQLKGRGSSNSANDGIQRKKGKYNHTSMLPPRLRPDRRQSNNKRVGSGSPSRSSTSEAKEKRTGPQSGAQEKMKAIPVPDEVLVTTTVASVTIDTTEIQTKNTHDRMSWSIDSGVNGLNGTGEELSSSCESNVFDEQSPVESSQVSFSSTLPLTTIDCIPAPSCEVAIQTEQERPSIRVVVPSLSRCSSTSDMDEDVFQDALSYLPVNDKLRSASSSTTSSAFVTPASTRSQSPVNDLGSSFNGRAGLTNSLDLVQNSLKLLAQEHDFNLITTSAVSPEESLTCDSHVTLIDGHVTDSEGTPVCPYSFVHNSSIFGEKTDTSQVSPEVLSLNKEHSGDTVFQMLVGEIEVEVDGRECEKSFTFGLPPSPLELNDEEHDSGCGMSIGSPAKSTLLTKARSKRPEIIHIPREAFRNNKVCSKSPQIPRGSFEFSSLSTASPQSSICSSNSSPLLSLSPSPTPPIADSSQVPPQSSTDMTTINHEIFQDWPDIEPHNTQPLVKNDVPHNLVAARLNGPPFVNGFVPGTYHSNPPSEHHQPTPEDMLRMKQWHNNLIAQLRQQQERLDQKKKQKQLDSSLPPQLQHSHPHEHHQFLPHEALPPLGLQGPPPPPGTHHPPLPNPIPPHMFRSRAPPPPPPTHHMIFHGPPPPHILMRPPPPHLPPPAHQAHSQSQDWPDSFGSCQALGPKPHPETPPPLPVFVSERAVHPLCSKWVMWYDKIMGSHRNSYSDYKKSLKKVDTIGSIEDFWKLFNNIKLPSVLENSTNYHFFKQGVYPLWEDSANKQGGKWVLTVKDNPLLLDRTWMEVLLMLISGCVSKKSLVNGVVVSRRKKGNRIAVWTSQKGKKPNLEICKELIGALTIACDVQTDQLPTFIKHLSECKNGLGLAFMHHTDSLKSGSSYQNESHIKLRDHIGDLLHNS